MADKLNGWCVSSRHHAAGFGHPHIYVHRPFRGEHLWTPLQLSAHVTTETFSACRSRALLGGWHSGRKWLRSKPSGSADPARCLSQSSFCSLNSGRLYWQLHDLLPQAVARWPSSGNEAVPEGLTAAVPC